MTKIAFILILAITAFPRVTAVGFLDFAYTGTDASKKWVGHGLTEAIGMSMHTQKDISVMSTRQMKLHRDNHKTGNKPADIYTFGDFLDQDFLISSEYNIEADTVKMQINIWNIRKQALYPVTLQYYKKTIFEIATEVTKEFYAKAFSDTTFTPLPVTWPKVDDKVFSIFAIALEHEASGRIAEALYSCVRAIELSPDFTDAKLLHIALRIESGEYKQAVKLAKELFKKNPANSRVIAAYGTALVSSGKSEEAIAFMKLHKEQSYNSPFYTEALARAYLKEGFYVIAVSQLVKTITMKPGISELYYLMGKAYYDSEDFSKAVKALERAVALEPKNNDFRCMLGMAYRESDDKIKAIRVLEALNSDSPDYLPAAFQLSATYNELGWSRKAYQSLQKPVREYPKNGELQAALGVTYLRMGQIKDADDAFAKALKLNSKSTMVLNNAGVNALERKKYDDAVKYLSKALKIEKRNPGISYNLAAAYFNLNKPRPAEKYLKITLESSPRHLEARKLMAEIKNKDEDIDGELAILAELISLTPNDYDTKIRYARLLSLKGDYEAGVAVVEDVVKNNPGNQDYFAELIESYKLIRWYDIAILKLENLLQKNNKNDYAAAQLGEIIVRKLMESGRSIQQNNPEALKALYLLKQAYTADPARAETQFWYAKATAEFKKDMNEARTLFLQCNKRGLPALLQKEVETYLKRKK
ncbi:MAG: tetratricopeptide repeat protein [Fibrobacteres bacterium]|nr:tetratricopeptide repeat protein [Fibrobacterota bacterium]